MVRIVWLPEPEREALDAAGGYLELHVHPTVAMAMTDEMLRVPTVTKLVSDILRASDLPLIGVDDARVKRATCEIEDHHKMSPVLLVRGMPLIIADGYHLLCAIHRLDPLAEVECRLISEITEREAANGTYARH